MEEIVRAIKSGEPSGLAEALIRLWVLGESTEGGFLVASRWQTLPAAVQQIDIDEHSKLEDADLLASLQNHPFGWLKALDTYRQENRRHSYYGKSLAALPTCLINDRKYVLIQRRFRRNIPADRQPPNLEYWCKHHSVIPLRIDQIDISIHSTEQFGPCGPDPKKPISIRLSHFADNVSLTVVEDHAQGTFHAIGLNDPGARWQSLLHELQAALDGEAEFWVAPELTIPLDLQERLQKEVSANSNSQFRIYIPGSFHADEAAGKVNCSLVLNGYGMEIARHRKMTQYSYRTEDADPTLTLSEGILTSRKITLLDTPLGLVGVAICKDFSDASDPTIAKIWDRIAPDWLLVPSYGTKAETLKRHGERADQLWKLRATRSIIANQTPYWTANGKNHKDEDAPGFVQANKEQVQGSSGSNTLSVCKPERRKLERIK